MCENKFPFAKIFDPVTGSYECITKGEYNAEAHAGRIECPDEYCNASLSYTPAGFIEANTKERSAYFSANGRVPHRETCSYKPVHEEQVAFNMCDALAADKYIVLNLNFLTSYDRDKARLKDKFAESVMRKWHGDVRSQWIKNHGKTKQQEKQYQSFSCADYEHMAKRLAAFKRAEGMLGGKYVTRLMVGHLHGIVPWMQFLAKDAIRIDPDKADAFAVSDVANRLHTDMAIVPKNVLRVWGGVPILRMGLGLYPDAVDRGGEFLRVNRSGLNNVVKINERKMFVQDVLHVPNKELRAKISNSKSFSFVAMPYVRRQSFDKARGDANELMVHWPVCSPSQVRLVV